MMRAPGLCLLLAVVVGCGGRQDKSTAPEDVPPLPPTKSTSVRLLLDEAVRLDLTQTQRGKLVAIDSELEKVNNPLEARALELETSSPQAKKKGARSGGNRVQPRVGMRAGGMGAGMGPGGPNGVGPGGMRGGGPANTPAQQRPPPKQGAVRVGGDARARAIRGLMERNNRIALARALRVLGAPQRATAAKVLSEHGHQVPDPALADASFERAPMPGAPTSGDRDQRQARGERFIKCLIAELALSKAQTVSFEHALRTSKTPQEQRDAVLEILSPGQRSKLRLSVQTCQQRATGTAPGS